MKLKGIKGRGKRPTVGRKQSFSIKDYKDKSHVMTCDSVNKDNIDKIKDIAKDFVSSIIESEVMGHGRMTRISGKKDKDLGYGVVIANMQSCDMIAPICFGSDEDALHFSKYVSRVFLHKNFNVFEGILETLDPSKTQCKELENAVLGFSKMIEDDKKNNELPSIWN